MSICDSLNPMQQEAVCYTDGPLLILAGAGSGKTRVLTHRIAYLLKEKNVAPWNILAITFTNKAADEMKQRVKRLAEESADQIWVSTIHSACVRILRRFADHLGYENNFTIYDTDDQKTLMKQVIKKLDLDPKKYREKVMIGIISDAKNRILTPQKLRGESAGNYLAEKAAEVYEIYQQELMKNNAMDFDDLLMNAVVLLQNNPEILDLYQEKFRYILVDEYQDTNHVQFELIRLLAGKYKNICVVGDDDQSIYKFRGADITNILSFEEYFPGTKVIKLEQNYRSTMNILEAANEVIRHNRGRKNKRLWSENGDGDPVSFCRYESGDEEAEGVIRRIRELVRKEGYRYSDCAVLYRTNAQSRAFEEKCIEKNIPYRLIGGINFYQRQEIKDMLAYLKTIDSGRDELAVKRIINVPKRGIGAATLAKVSQAAEKAGIGFFAAMEDPEKIPGLGKAAGKIQSFVNQIRGFRKAAEDSDIGELIETIMEGTGYLEELEELDDETAQQKKDNLGELITKAVNFQAGSPEATLTDFLEEVALVADIDSLDQTTDHVTLMTLHGAKGLEFPVIFLTGMEEGLFPGYIAINSEDPTDIEEERRLCYVGITRAMKKLYLSAAAMRMIRGEIQANGVSRFVEEIPKGMLNEESPGKHFFASKREVRYEKRDGTEFFGGIKGKDAFSFERQIRYGQTEAYEAESTSEEKRFKASTQNFDRAGIGASETERFGRETSEFDRSERGVSGFDGFGTGTRNFGKSAAGSVGFGKSINAMVKKLPDYKEGDRVSHAKFGEGTVTEIRDGKKDYEVTVNFDKSGVRRILAGFANLTKLKS